jgi:hypothetical protein
MKTILVVSSLAALLVSGAAYADFHADLAFHHAPVHYQDTDSSDYPSDFITAFDYDSDWIATNNWDHRAAGRWPATVYYSIVESCTHYFITYAFFHPRDWSDVIFDQEHENDLEGALMVVRKDGSAYGTLEGMITVFHTNFFSFTPVGSPLTDGNETIDGRVSFQDHNGVGRPKTVQEAKGHGLKAWPYASDFDGGADQDGVVYFPTVGQPEYPASGNDRNVPYRLVDINRANGLWSAALNDAKVSSGQANTFHSWGRFKGDTSGGCGSRLKSCSKNAANAPWGWDDPDDGPTYRGEFALDPAHLVAHYFGGLGSFSHQYVRNPFLADLRAANYSSSNPPRGFPSNLSLDALYAKLGSGCPARSAH